mmetsp:Transcript_24202/g.40017  ORF Transcript_24202/g.40017 Transcript_24202/m.40017 type:complete len:80 (+) Transcript_24202:291-530(+)
MSASLAQRRSQLPSQLVRTWGQSEMGISAIWIEGLFRQSEISLVACVGLLKLAFSFHLRQGRGLEAAVAIVSSVKTVMR